MKLLAWLILALLVLPVGLLWAQEPLPQPVGYVNDFAQVIPADVEPGLEEALRLFEEETSVELVVATIPSLGGASVEDYSLRLFEHWGVGKQGVDNGVLMVVAVRTAPSALRWATEWSPT